MGGEENQNNQSCTCTYNSSFEAGNTAAGSTDAGEI